MNIGENVPVADFGHYADYCAQLIPLSLLKSTLGGGDGARVMLHQMRLWCIFSLFSLSLFPLSLLKSTLGDGDGARVMLHQNMLVVYFFTNV